MKHSNLVQLLLACALPALAVTQHVAYTGGKQSGTFELKGSYSSWHMPGTVYPDTLMLDSALRIVAFTEEAYNGKQGQAGYWLFFENPLGEVGFRNATDTVWSEATTFPSTPLRLDSIAPIQDPLGRFWPANLSGKRLGLKMRTLNFGSEGLGWAYSVDRLSGDNRTVYFRLNKSQGVRYGKILLSRDSIYTGVNPVPGGNKQLASVTLRYMMFSSAEYDATPMALRPAIAESRPPSTRLIWSQREGLRLRDTQGRVYNLHGKRLPEPTRLQP